MIQKAFSLVTVCILAFACQSNNTNPSKSLEETKALFNTDVPEAILTPDRVDTRIGALNYFDGIPTEETAELIYDNLDFMRGVETFLNGIPAASMEGLRYGLEEIGVKHSYQIPIADRLMDSDPFFLTGNTSTVYATPFLDLKKDGATVVEIPAGAGPGTVNDAFFRFVIDMGGPGPDRGQGGKYLILPPDYEGNLEGPIGGKEQIVNGEKYFVVQSPTYVNWIPLRGFLVDGKPDEANKMWKEGLKIYPLSQANNPPEMEFISVSEKEMNTVHANNFEFYDELNRVVQREPLSFLDPELRGLFASIGIQKGKEFAPDDRMKKILNEAVAVGNATARATLWYERNPDEFLYEGSNWKRGYPGNNYQFLKDQGAGGRNLDARTMFFYFATVNTPMMAMKLIGKGSQYAWGYLDTNDNYLDGSKSYKVNIPADPPALKFWSMCVYDPQTRSMLQTDNAFPSKQSQRDSDMIKNEDGSIDLYFGPKAPEGLEANWIQTIPGKGFFMVLRLYSPTEAWYDKEWRPGDIEMLK